MNPRENHQVASVIGNGQRGFTIMEVLIVLAIIALIMGVLVGPKLFKAGEDAKRRSAHTIAVQFAAAYGQWSMDHQEACPGSLNDLTKYMHNREDIKDPWGHDFVMVCGPNAPAGTDGFGVMSVGKDGQPDTADDIKSWEKPSN